MLLESDQLRSIHTLDVVFLGTSNRHREIPVEMGVFGRGLGSDLLEYLVDVGGEVVD